MFIFIAELSFGIILLLLYIDKKIAETFLRKVNHVKRSTVSPSLEARDARIAFCSESHTQFLLFI